MKTALFLSMLLITGSLLARNLDKTFQLLPQPQSIEIQAGKGLDYGELSYVVADGEAPIPAPMKCSSTYIWMPWKPCLMLNICMSGETRLLRSVSTTVVRQPAIPLSFPARIPGWNM